MSTTSTIQISPFPTTEEVALTLLQWLFASIGVPTDYNIGSIVRTYSEALGSVEEIEGISAQAQAVQALVYSAYAAFGISPLAATGSVGTVTFSTLASAPLPTGLSVAIPTGSLIQTSSALQFQTTANAVLVSGTTSVNVPIQSVVTGSATNVAANTIVQILTGLAYPLAVTNAAPTAGGSDAETAAQTLARFLAYVDSLGLCSPIAVASAVIGQSYLQETVKYSTCYEPWIVQVEESETPTAGFDVIIDNGTGTASANLISVVTTYLSNGLPAGYRPAGVPFSVLAVTPVDCSVVVTGTSINSSLAQAISSAIQQAITAYFSSLGFGISAQLTQLIAAIANSTIGQLSALSVTLLDSNNVSQQTITAGPTERVILTGSAITIS